MTGLTAQIIADVVKFHGHMCPGLALGIRAAEVAWAQVGVNSPENPIIAIVETDLCPADAIQYLTGCTFGKGNLVHLDHGKNAFTFIRLREGRGVRVVARPDAFGPPDPDFVALSERVRSGEASAGERARFDEIQRRRAETILQMPIDRLFQVKTTEAHPPPRNRTMRWGVCDGCGEPVLISHLEPQNGGSYCRGCLAGK
ncbi:MAG: formylmethanofuran dehydrogenase [Chloroflexota bacterium]